MRNIRLYIIGLVMLAAASSCIKNEEITLKDSDAMLEFDASANNANAAGVDYPVLTRVPGYGRPVLSAPLTVTIGSLTNTIPADPQITRTSGIVKFRVNLVSRQRSVPIEVNYIVYPAGTTAVSGVHYTVSGKAIIPANSSFAEIEVNILDPGASSESKVLVLELMESGGIKPSFYDKRLGIRISQS
jgi:hypothetical protein